LTEEALDRTVLRTRYGRRRGSILGQRNE